MVSSGRTLVETSRFSNKYCKCYKGCLNYQRLGGLNNRKLFLIVLELGSQRSEYQSGWVRVRALFLVCNSCLLDVYLHQLEREEASTLIIWSPSLASLFPKDPHLQVSSYWGWGFNMNFGRTQTFKGCIIYYLIFYSFSLTLFFLIPFKALISDLSHLFFV